MDTPITITQTESQVYKWINELKEAAAIVGETHNELKSRLNPVLRLEPQVAGETGMEPQEELVPVAHEIRMVTEELHRNASANREILCRLEV